MIVREQAFLSNASKSTTSRAPSKSRKRRRKRWSFISPTGEVIHTSSIRRFAEKYGMRYSNAKSLACGHYSTLMGFCSTHPRAKARRAKFTKVLRDTRTGRDYVLGAKMKTFAKNHNICYNDLSLLILGHRLMCKGYTLLKTWELAQNGTAEYVS